MCVSTQHFCCWFGVPAPQKPIHAHTLILTQNSNWMTIFYSTTPSWLKSPLRVILFSFTQIFMGTCVCQTGSVPGVTYSGVCALHGKESADLGQRSYLSPVKDQTSHLTSLHLSCHF